MAQTVAEWLVGAAGLYLAAGVVFAVPFVVVGVGKIDQVAAQGSVGFRLIILPGVVALWPLLALPLAAGHRHRRPRRGTRTGAAAARPAAAAAAVARRRAR